MKLSIVSGSHRKNSQSLKVAQFVRQTLQREFSTLQIYLLDLGENPIPLWDEEMWTKSDKWQKIWLPHSQELASSQGFVFVTPEWSGMVPAGLKNFFLLCSHSELAHKPGLIVSVSSGYGGAYPVAELRMSSYKNTHICFIPEHVIVRKVETVLNSGDKPISKDDTYLRSRLGYAVKILHKYAEALVYVRESGLIDHKTYPYGM